MLRRERILDRRLRGSGSKGGLLTLVSMSLEALQWMSSWFAT
jgi:hypothetical protein